MRTSADYRRMWEKISHIPYLHPEALPSMELYMDQVTSFMEEHLSGWRRTPEDKILTRTMINNYTKNRLIPPPVKKKYNMGHLLLLNYIYYLKNVLCIKDIATLLQPLSGHFWARPGGPDLQHIYRKVLSSNARFFRSEGEEIQKMAEAAEDAAEEEHLPEEETSFLKDFLFACLLALDISMKKRMMESVIDSMKPVPEKKSRKSSDAKKEKKNNQSKTGFHGLS